MGVAADKDACMAQKRPFDLLRTAVLEYDAVKAIEIVHQLLIEKVPPQEIMDVLTNAIREVGDAFNREELFLPDLVGGAEVLMKIMPILKDKLVNQAASDKHCRIIIGTVFGDIHNIGKNMVATMLVASGFEVIDLGINVTADKFVKAVIKYHPKVVAMSALMTSTMREQKKVIELLEERGLRNNVFVIVGGGAVTSDFAEEINADGYESTAPRAAYLVNKLLKKT